MAEKGRTVDVVWSVPCPKCNAPIGAPCADWRTHDRDLFGRRIHKERRAAIRAAR